MSEIVKQLRKIRRDKEISQEALAALMGKAAGGDISQWEKGGRNPTLATLDIWSNALGYRLTLEPKE